MQRKVQSRNNTRRWRPRPVMSEKNTLELVSPTFSMLPRSWSFERSGEVGTGPPSSLIFEGHVQTDFHFTRHTPFLEQNPVGVHAKERGVTLISHVYVGRCSKGEKFLLQFLLPSMSVFVQSNYAIYPIYAAK